MQKLLDGADGKSFTEYSLDWHPPFSLYLPFFPWYMPRWLNVEAILLTVRTEAKHKIKCFSCLLPISSLKQQLFIFL
jgi:hypothetical protein